MNNKKEKDVVKLAVIRDNESQPCPFGLSVPHACKNVGDTIDQMAPMKVLGPDATQKELGELLRANKFLMLWNSKGHKCKYAAMLFPNKEKVNCSYGDTAEGYTDGPAIVGSPYFAKNLSGIALDGLYTFPLGYYAEYNLGRNIFYGIYSLNNFIAKLVKK